MGYIKHALVLFLFSFLIKTSSAQDKKYDTLWTKVDRLLSSRGLTNSALTEVKKIYALAKKENNDAQLIKSLIYQGRIMQRYEENAVQKSINELEAELKTIKEPALSVLHSVLAERYLDYLQDNRWRLYGRTETTVPNENIETWSAEQFHKTITAHYLASVKNERLLQQTDLGKFDPLIIKGNTRALRPTLFDFLAHRAINYFRNEERDVTRPAYAFFIDDPAAFAEARAFIGYRFVTSDSLSLQHKAIQLYQRLLAFHSDDSKPEAFIDADINRLQFVRQYGQMENKDSLYLTALESITQKFPDYKTGGPGYYLIARYYADQAAKYDALKDTSHRFDYVKAKAIAEKIVDANKDNEVETNTIDLLNTINRQHLQLHTEKVNIPEQPFRTLVNFRNVENLHLRVIRLSDAMKNELAERYDDRYWQQLTGLPSLRNWSQPLPLTNDYQQHAVEIKIDQLPVGHYLLLASSDEQFRFNTKVIAAQYFHVSNISYVNNRTDYFVLHRESGKPLVNASVQVWNYQYDYTARKNVLKPAEKVQADQHGFFRLKERTRGNESYRLEFNYNNDRLFEDDYQYGIFRDPQRPDASAPSAAAYEKANGRVFLFTDRSIYRPGQKIYFKGISITRDFVTKKNKILSAHNTTVRLYNANGELVDSIKLTTNEFGSYNGSFQLPENVLNGSYRLRDDVLNSEIYFYVEEYKRPKFYVEYEEVKGSYKLNDSILVSGVAKAYAGNNINGATVTYSIIREARFPYPWRIWKWGYPRTNRMEIAHGVAVTDAEGRFSVRFKAIPDRTINPAMEPVFDYKITSNITDINGETRVGEKIIPVSYKALQIKINVHTTAMPVDSLKNIIVSTTNLNGQHETSKVKLQIFRLQPPDRMLRNRYWQKPDLFIMNKETYTSYFPIDEYDDESKVETWQRLEKLFETEDSSRLAKPFAITNAKLTEGWYVIEASTKDKYGQEVKDLKYINLYDDKNNKMQLPVYRWTAQQSDTIQPGQRSLIGIGSSATDLFVIQHIDREVNRDRYLIPKEEQQIPVYQFLSLNKEKKWLDFPVDEKDRGGFGVYHFFVKDNRYYVTANIVSVPWSNKELSISYESFRDKTLPGSNEKWKVKISGYKNEKVAAELLASMYDASLDQFSPHQWNAPAIWPVYDNYNFWYSTPSFIEVISQQKEIAEKSGRRFYKEYDMLIDDTEELLMNTGIRRGVVAKATTAAPMVANQESRREMMDASMKQQQSDEESSADGLTGSKATQGNDVPVQVRRNFNETAFFLPDLRTDADGNIEFGFTIPEALTRWKFQALSHTKELAFALSTREIVTQKEMMVQPNAPRFLREGDRLELSTKIVNLSGREITGTVQLELFNAATMTPVDGWFQNAIPNQYFTAEAGQSVAASFRIEVPYQFNNAVVYRFTAKSTDSANSRVAVSDAEEAALPVLSNTLLVTETMPLPVQGSQVKKFNFQKLLNAGSSETLKHHAITVEFTSNPAWYAVQALPYLADPAIESADYLFNRFYANAIASKIANSSPRIREIFERWKNADTAALLSNLQKNQELKSVLLQETPWVLQAKTEAEQKKNIAVLFDMVKMGQTLSASLNRMKEMQSPNGGFMWFKGGPDDRYITQYILTSIGHLKKLDALPPQFSADINQVVAAGLKYLDERIKDDYNKLSKEKKPTLDKNHLGQIQVQYLYMRSFFNEYPIPGASFNAVNYYRKQSQQYWLQHTRYLQGMIALSLFRTGDKVKAGEILKSLKENSLYNEEMGRYWKENTPGYYWYQAPVETQSLLIEAFTEIQQEEKSVNEMKTWLLKQKQTQNWKSNKATADACYALLMSPDTKSASASWLNNTPQVEISLGQKLIRSSDAKEEAGTGYFKTMIAPALITPEMGNISVKVTASGTDAREMPSWGAVYWQYFERLEKISTASTPLKIVKQLFIERNTDRGPVLQPVTEGQTLKPGDKIKVRIELTSDRNMEYVHMKDMRASCMEPVNVISGYRWQGGLGYYETTKDASTSFFFSWLPKGTYVFEYPLFVTQTGNFSNGITSIQSLYAPEFASHSEGVRVSVE